MKDLKNICWSRLDNRNMGKEGANDFAESLEGEIECVGLWFLDLVMYSL